MSISNAKRRIKNLGGFVIPLESEKVVIRNRITSKVLFIKRYKVEIPGILTKEIDQFLLKVLGNERDCPDIIKVLTSHS
jgi:hypothetical protein